jgi:hypothetical protein
MKKVFTIIIVCFSFLVFSQVNVGPKIKVAGYSPDKFHPDAIKQLKRTKTYFVYGEQDKDQLESWTKALQRSWTITSFGFMSIEDFNKLDPKEWQGKSFLMKYQETYVWEVRGDYGVKTNSLAYPCLTLVKIRPGGEYYFYCRIDLAPDLKTSGYKTKFHRLSQKEKGKYLYNKAVFHNWYPGLLMGPLGFVNKSLLEEKPSSIFKGMKTKDALGELKTKTLCVPEYVFLYRGGYDKDNPYVDIEKVKSKYDYKIKIVSAERLSELILEGKRDIYLLSYSRIIHDKFISVYNTGNCELLYKKRKANSHNIKKSDFKKLAKAVRKAGP